MTDLTSAPPTGNGGFPYKFFKGSNIGLKFTECAPITSGVAGKALRDFATLSVARWGDNPGTTFFGGGNGIGPLKYGSTKMFKIRCNFEQLSTLTTNISGTHRDIDKGKTALSTTAIPALNKIKLVKIWSTNKKVIGARVDPP